MCVLAFCLMSSPSLAVDSSKLATQIMGLEDCKQATKKILNSALKMTRSKLAIRTATIIVCFACIPAAAGSLLVSPRLCITCDILIFQTLG